VVENTWNHKKVKVRLMKKIVVLLGTLLIIGLIVFTLFKNKAEIAHEARLNPITSYPVTVVAATRQNLSQNISQVGVIAANNEVAVVSQLSGKVTAVMVQPGAYIRAGSPIVRVENEIPQSKLTSAQTSYERAKKDLERSVLLHQKGLIADSELDAVQQALKAAEASYVQAQHDYNNAVITSPISGVVASRPANLGAMLTSGTVVAEVVDTSRFKMNLNISEEYAFKLKAGDRVVIASDVYPGVQFDGRIHSISVKGDANHTYPVEIDIPNPGKEYPLKSGMYATASFTLPSLNALTIPRTALVGSRKTPQVYVVEAGKAQLRDLVVGPEAGTDLVVLEGLNEGDQVVFSGQDNLKDGSEVNVTSDDAKRSESAGTDRKQPRRS
jgi:RND family efflux transporter MFP subunit